MNVQTIRNAIADRIRTVCQINAYAYDVATTIYPRVIVLPRTGTTVEYHPTMSNAGLSVLNFDVELKVTAAEPESAQIARDQFVSSGSSESLGIVDALEQVSSGATTPTLGGAVENIVVESVSLSNGFQLETGEYEFTATFAVSVLARRN